MAEAHDGSGGGLDLFLEWAGRTGEMNPTTANSYRTAAGKILGVTEDTDGTDVTTLDIEAVLARWENLNRTKYSSGSLLTYKSRFRQAVTMYKAWLVKDPDWKQAGKGSSATGSKPATKQGRPRKSADAPTRLASSDIVTNDGRPSDLAGVRMVAYDMPLRPDLLVRLTLPIDLTKHDAERISAFVSSLAFTSANAVSTATSTDEGG